MNFESWVWALCFIPVMGVALLILCMPVANKKDWEYLEAAAAGKYDPACAADVPVTGGGAVGEGGEDVIYYW
jgi:hypothetical protein